MCTVLKPPGVHPTAANKYIILYQQMFHKQGFRFSQRCHISVTCHYTQKKNHIVARNKLNRLCSRTPVQGKKDGRVLNMFHRPYTIQYISPSAHHLHAWYKTHHITISSTTPHRLNNLNSQDFNHCPFLNYISITYIILNEIIIIFNCYGVTVTQLTTFVLFYSCNNNITPKIDAIAAETCWWEYSE
jgi:hypothetical protein